MSDFKSKLPDLSELSSMAGKMCTGVKNIFSEIIHDYKKKRTPTNQTTNYTTPSSTPDEQTVSPVIPKPKKTPVKEKTADKPDATSE